MPKPSSQALPLIGTKLAPPRLSSASVERKALLNLLEGRSNRKLGIVLGPAGSGKTSLLAQWRKRRVLQGATVAWYNAGPDDDDIHIAAYIMASLQQAGLTLGNGGLQLFARSEGKTWQPLLAALVNDIQESGLNICLVIDDFHNITSFPFLQLFKHWLDLMPDNFQIVLGSRTQPPLDLWRMKAEDQLTEIVFDDLRFNEEEARRFVDSRGMSRLSQAQVSSLHSITDGWIAGMQLLTFSVRNSKRAEEALLSPEPMSLSQESSLNDYLEESVASSLPSTYLTFLSKISICRRFTSELCEQLTSDPAAKDLIRKIESENLFLLPIDSIDKVQWYRFHSIFSAFLQKRLDHLPAGEIQKLHQTASRWFAAHELSAEALRHAGLTGDQDLLIEQVERWVPRMAYRAQFSECMKWCNKIPWERLRTRPLILLGLGLAQTNLGYFQKLENTLAALAEHPDQVTQTGTQLLKAYRAMRQDDTHAQMRAINEVQKHPPATDTVQHLAFYAIAGFVFIKSNLYSHAREMHRSFRITDGRADKIPFIDILPGISYLAEGNVRAALSRMEKPFSIIKKQSVFATDAAGLMAGYMIEAHFQLNHLDEAHALLDQYQAIIDAIGAVDSLLSSYRVHAQLHSLGHDDDAALKTLKQLEEHGQRLSLDRLIASSLFDQICLLLPHDPASVDELANRLNILAARYLGSTQCAWADIPLAADLATAEITFARSTELAGLAAIDAATRTAEINGNQMPLLRLQVMRAILQFESGQTEEAIRIGSETLRTAFRLGQLRLLLGFGSRIKPLIFTLQKNELDAELQEWMTSSLNDIESHTSAASESTTVTNESSKHQKQVKLRPKELEILNLLSRGLSVKTIALAVNVSQGTARWHIKNIYIKLEVNSKDAAMNKARALNLLV